MKYKNSTAMNTIPQYSNMPKFALHLKAMQIEMDKLAGVTYRGQKQHKPRRV